MIISSRKRKTKKKENQSFNTKKNKHFINSFLYFFLFQITYFEKTKQN